MGAFTRACRVGGHERSLIACQKDPSQISTSRRPHRARVIHSIDRQGCFCQNVPCRLVNKDLSPRGDLTRTRVTPGERQQRHPRPRPVRSLLPWQYHPHASRMHTLRGSQQLICVLECSCNNDLTLKIPFTPSPRHLPPRTSSPSCCSSGIPISGGRP